MRKYDRSSLKRLGVVGEPTNHQAFYWYQDVVGEVHMLSQDSFNPLLVCSFNRSFIHLFISIISFIQLTSLTFYRIPYVLHVSFQHPFIPSFNYSFIQTKIRVDATWWTPGGRPRLAESWSLPDHLLQESRSNLRCRCALSSASILRCWQMAKMKYPQIKNRPKVHACENVEYVVA